MLDKTLGYVLCCQSPALFLAALVLIIHYFAARRKHRFKAVLKLLLGIVCAVGGVVRTARPTACPSTMWPTRHTGSCTSTAPVRVRSGGY